jgi:hypothetical protein
MNLKAQLALVISIAASAAIAEDKAPVVPVNIPAVNCEKPGDPPLQPSYDQQKRYDKKREGYKECVMKYVADMKQRADAEFEAGKKYQDAANGAIEDYNSWASQFNAKLKKDK